MTNDERELLRRLRIVPDKDCRGRGFYICGSHPHVPGSLESKCTLCGQPIYFSKDPPGLTKICFDCGKPMMDAQPLNDIFNTQSSAVELAELILLDRKKN